MLVFFDTPLAIPNREHRLRQKCILSQALTIHAGQFVGLGGNDHLGPGGKTLSLLIGIRHRGQSRLDPPASLVEIEHGKGFRLGRGDPWPHFGSGLSIYLVF